MFKKTIIIVTAMLLTSVSAATFARGGGSGGGMSGGMSSNHISNAGLRNTNGPHAADRDKGLQRAEDRRNSKSLAHKTSKSRHRISKHKKHIEH
jgi:hypothetical protein